MHTQPCTIVDLARYKIPFEAPEEKGVYTLDAILNDVCRALGQPIEAALSKSRNRDIVVCRMVYFYVASEKTAYTLVEIGDMVSKDHTSVIDAIQTALEYLLNNDLKFIEKWIKYKANSRLFTSKELTMQILPTSEQEVWLRNNYKMYSNYHLSVKLGISQRMLSMWLKHFELCKRKITRDPLAVSKAKKMPMQPSEKLKRPPAVYSNTSWAEKVNELLNP